MRLTVVGSGQAGSMLAQELLITGEEVHEDRKLRILAGNRESPITGQKSEPLTVGVFAINSATTDLSALTRIPAEGRNRILIGTESGRGGYGAGKNNLTGAKLAKESEKDILEAIRNEGNVGECEAILVIASTSGGTGSGSAGVITKLLKENFAKPVYLMLLLPFAEEYDNPAAMENTATCLKKVLGDEESKPAALILVDNQLFGRRNQEAFSNLRLINKQIAHTLRDLLCASEENDPRHSSENTIDIKDVLETLKGVTAIGMGRLQLPKKPRLSMKRNYLSNDESIKRGRKVLSEAFENLSVECANERIAGEDFYEAGQALCLFSAPPSEATSAMTGMMEKFFAERVSGAKLRRGSYMGGDPEAISFTVVLSNIGTGTLTEKIRWFFERGAIAQERTEESTKNIEDAWGETLKASEKLNKDL